MPKVGEKRQAMSKAADSSPDVEGNTQNEFQPTSKASSNNVEPLYGATSSQKLNQQAQMLVDEINVKRKNDSTMLADFRKELEGQMDNWCTELDESMIRIYEKNSKSIQEKLQELYATLDRVGELERELMSFRDVVSNIYNDMRTED